jgi:hypothetical protein
MDEAPIEIAES